jgi:LacI family transcriptional regulator
MAAFRRVAIMIDLQWPLNYHQDVFAGTQRYARERGDRECVVDLYACESLRAGRGRSAYDGVVARATPRLVARAKRARVPVVNVWLNSPARNVPSVFHDVEASGRMAAKHLMARGLRQFGHLGYFRDRTSRLQAGVFRAAVSAAGFPCSFHLAPMECARHAAVWKKFQAGLEQWIDSWECPIGVCVAHDVLARYLATVCQRRKVRVPDDAAMISTYNERIICLHPEPSLSSIDFGFEEIGFRAAALLDRLMAGARPPKKPVLVEPVELAARQSTDVFAVGDPVVARAMRFIAENGNGPLRVGDVADHVHVGRRTLERRFRRALGRTRLRGDRATAHRTRETSIGGKRRAAEDFGSRLGFPRRQAVVRDVPTPERHHARGVPRSAPQSDGTLDQRSARCSRGIHEMSVGILRVPRP